IWMTVDIGDGASCHVGYRSCFYRSIPMGPIDNGRKIEMEFLEKEKEIEMNAIYQFDLKSIKLIDEGGSNQSSEDDIE
ncbi:MAG: hypothetical protein ACPG6Z_00160, partial [Nitrosopumilus sp.]